uniref:Uncharacterized protein n=1 Tax=Leersia perrieri TaxID=77586 RepID=A0A0D9WIR1_9ORYZ
MEEFQESDVLWPEHHQQHNYRRDVDGRGGGHHQKQSGSNATPARQPSGGNKSAPVGIPVMMIRTAKERDEAAARSHEVAAARAKRWSEERAAFSVCVGNGRTLKGRELRSVRTAVLRMTGFLET